MLYRIDKMLCNKKEIRAFIPQAYYDLEMSVWILISIIIMTALFVPFFLDHEAYSLEHSFAWVPIIIGYLFFGWLFVDEIKENIEPFFHNMMSRYLCRYYDLYYPEDIHASDAMREYLNDNRMLVFITKFKNHYVMALRFCYPEDKTLFTIQTNLVPIKPI